MRELAADQGTKLSVTTRRGKRSLAHVPVQVKARVVRPDWIREPQRRLLQPLAQSRHEMDALGDPVGDHRPGQAGFEHEQSADGHVDGPALGRER